MKNLFKILFGGLFKVAEAVTPTTWEVTKVKVTKKDFVSKYGKKDSKDWIGRIVECHSYVNFCFYKDILFAVECVDEKTYENGKKVNLYSVIEVEGTIGDDIFPWMYTEQSAESNKFISDVLNTYRQKMNRYVMSCKQRSLAYIRGKFRMPLFEKIYSNEYLKRSIPIN